MVGVVLRTLQGFEVALYVRAPQISRQPIRVPARQEWIAAVGGNPIQVQTPTPRHGGTTPPHIKIAVHPDQPTGEPMVEVKVIGRQGRNQEHGNR